MVLPGIPDRAGGRPEGAGWRGASTEIGVHDVTETRAVSRGAVVVIPARLESRRFPRKVLVRETGKFLIEHVHEGVRGTEGVSRVIVATDSEEVRQAVLSFGGEVWLTSPEHVSGTDRVAEVARGLEEDIVINVQGDEPSIRREDLARLVEALRNPDGSPMATLARPRCDVDGFRDPNQVKVVTTGDGRALYFSRAPIPGSPVPGSAAPEEIGAAWLHHIGIYGYRREFLPTFTSLPPGNLEGRERLEQLRALENGYSIRVLLTEHEYAGIDTEDEYRAFVEKVMAQE